MNSSEPLLRVENLIKHFPITQGIVFQRQIGAVRAVDGISFTIQRGETLGLVGESGCGKTTAGRTILQLYRPTSGQVIFDSVDLAGLQQQAWQRTWGRLPQAARIALAGTGLPYLVLRTCAAVQAERDLREMRRRMQMIFQDPFGSLNPRWTINAIVGEPLRVHGLARTHKELSERVKELLELVGINPRMINRFPHEFSGGQRQRIGVARALASNPEFIVCDEPISALDVSIQAQVVNLLEDLQERFNLTYLFIAHDLSMVRHICSRVAVMYLGKLVELAEKDELYDQPMHPYTKALLSAVPIPDPAAERQRHRIVLQGDVPSPAHPPAGCYFNPRCAVATPQCRNEAPPWRDLGGGHFVACHL
jgi:oligopeptide transport system ATP-binding protein